MVNRVTAKPLLAALFVATAGASYYMNHYKVFFDTSMVRNVLHTDVGEARELISVSFLLYLLTIGVFPCLIVLRLQLAKRTWRKAFLARVGLILASILVAAAGIGMNFQTLSALMRNQKEIRYLLTPGNYLVSMVNVLTTETATARSSRIPLGTDAKLAASWSGRTKPVVLILVVGETARAANWGLNGYVRQTTPELSSLDIINFPQVTSCGTNTEVSVPCMFSPFGRKDYDEKKIRQHESLLHVLEHSGIKTIWRDNQSGCKGVCDGLEFQQAGRQQNDTFCNGERCLDEILLDRLEDELKRNQRNVVIVLHQLGNHGPAYSQRYPERFKRFTPTCDEADLGKCQRDQIVNSYDNALLYTDHILAETVQRLSRQTTHDAAMLYVSDHGESLGEGGFYLHGLPYAIAPKEQTRVPMVAWLSGSFAATFGIDLVCLKSEAQKPVSHDYLFHSVLGLLQVNTMVYDPAYDLFTRCRS
jgi:lipid A ethanolaminephosphotransferase